MRLVTIGGYGFDDLSFFAALKKNRVDTFVDIRQRRGVRGHEYAFLNSQRLQVRLAKEQIRYVYMPALAPTPALRQIQKRSDSLAHIAQRNRSQLSDELERAFNAQILRKYEASDFRNYRWRGRESGGDILRRSPARSMSRITGGAVVVRETPRRRCPLSPLNRRYCLRVAK